uniref:Coenzyme PQQ synthesis protein D (PqqD) n=1 Tax=Candidatus Kentrum sp. UNK TaxID=2126344 RepID=A0A451AS46_9GAMM|nr:MAG: Coenzyme PQQ synthesis protein D (PqqD) [Candidatus Kentron sp. UNK]VFK68807.1 MAG: Coenzyme PQQ synthesis protein D (PqqD) [Candidatus Kentron sp. UNK]
MSQFSLARKVSIAPDVLAQDLVEESVLLDLRSEQYFALDDIGTRMWQLLMEKGSIQATMDTLLAEYDVAPERLRQDMENLMEGLLTHGLIEIGDA